MSKSQTTPETRLPSGAIVHRITVCGGDYLILDTQGIAPAVFEIMRDQNGALNLRAMDGNTDG